MAQLYLDLLQAFGFTEMQLWIASISSLLFSANLLGGFLSAFTFVNSRKYKQRPLKERISFRLFCFSELILFVFIFFYHVFMIEMIQTEHFVYWVSAILMMPLLAVIGSQTILVCFPAKMAEKEKRLQKELRKARQAQRQKNADDKPAKDSGADQPPPLNGKSSPAERK